MATTFTGFKPIENVWAMLTKILYADGKQYQSISELKEELMLAWQSIKIKLNSRLVYFALAWFIAVNHFTFIQLFLGRFFS